MIRSTQWQRVFMIALFLGLMPAGGCVEVDGAACELSWSLRTFGGEPIPSCSRVNISEVVIKWESATPGEDESGVKGQVQGEDIFKCEEGRGVTDFIIAEGPRFLSIVPHCLDGKEPEEGTYAVPPPILREVRHGEVVTLGSLLIVAGCNNNICTCPGPGS